MISAIADFARKRRSYVAFVLLPFLLLALYYALIVTPRYVSEGRVIVEKDASLENAAIDLAGVSLSGGGSTLDVELVRQFVESPAMLRHLDQTHALRAHYSDSGADWISRLSATASSEDAFDYYLDRVEVAVNKDALTLDVRVEGFEPAYAQKIGEAIVRRTEQFVNDVGQGLAREQVAFVQGEVDKANARLLEAANALIDHQNEHGLLSPEIENQALSQVIAGLQQELARQRTGLKAFRAYLNDSAPEVIAARGRVSALERQIEQERAKQVRTGDNAALNDLLVRYKELELNVQVATDVYQSALRSLEVAKLDASRKVKHLVMVSAPTLPEESTRPRRLYTLTTLLVLLHLLYLVGAMLAAIVNDHRE